MKNFLMQQRGRTCLNIVWIIVNVLLYTGTSVLLTFTTDAVFSKNLLALVEWSVVNLLVWMTFLVSNYFQTVFQEKLTQRILVAVRSTISRKIAGKSYEQYHRQTTGEYLSEYVNDAGNIEVNAIKKFFALISSAATVLFATLALAAYHLLFLPVIFVLVILMLKGPSYLEKSMTTATKQLSDGNAAFSNQLTNVLNGFDVFSNANQLRQLCRLVKNAAQKYGHTKVAYTQTNTRVSNLIAALSIFCQVMVDVVTSVLAILGAIPLGAISSTGNIAASVFNSMSSLSNDAVQIKSTRPLFDKIAARAVNNEAASESISVPTFQRALKIVNLSYAIDGKKIFDHLNLIFNRGGKYAIVGRSGVGKSTLLKILNGQITDYHGHVYLDHHDIRTLTRAQLTGIGQYIDQNVYLFNDSVENNTALWRKKKHPDNWLQKALKKAQVDFVKSPHQLIKENGENLSGGQKQRLALARFFYAPKPIALLDEGTSALDPETAQAVTKAFLDDPDTTLIEVSHHLDAKLRAEYDGVIELGK